MKRGVTSLLLAFLVLAVVGAPFLIKAFRPREQQAVIVGAGGWLFPGWERRSEADPALVASRVEEVASIVAALQRVGVRTVVLVVPLKERQHGAMLPASEAARRRASDGFGTLVGQLRKRSVEVVATSPTFLRDDAHWTPASAEFAARQVARLANMPRGSSGARIGQWREELRRGDLAELLAQHGMPAPTATARSVRAYLGPAAGSPAVATVGNSFAADYLGFGPMLSHLLGVPVEAVVRERALGTWEAMAAFRQRGRRPAIVVWIIQEASFTAVS